MWIKILGLVFLFFLARIVIGVFRGFLPPKPGGRPPEAPGGGERSPLRGAEIEDADWEEIEDPKGKSG